MVIDIRAKTTDNKLFKRRRFNNTNRDLDEVDSKL